MISYLKDKATHELNAALRKESQTAFNLLADYGRTISFPQKGVISQTLESKHAKTNATIGVAHEEDGSLMVLDALVDQISLDGSALGYSSSYGNQELRELWRKEMVRKNPSLTGKNISSPVVTHALTQGLHILNKLFFDMEEPLYVMDPYWENYDLVFDKAEIEKVPLFDGRGLNLRGLDEILQGEDGEVKLLLNFPHNPTGYSPSTDEVETLVKMIKKSAERKNNILIICDDAYFGLTYGDSYRESLFGRFADLDERVLAVKVDGCSKEYFAWGLRVGFLTYGAKGMDKSYSVLENKTAAVIRAMSSSGCTLSQKMMVHALNDPDLERQKEEKFSLLKERYALVRDFLKDHPSDYFDALPFNSGYFMCIELKYNDAEEVRRKLLDDFSTGVIAVGHRSLRIAYSSMRKEDIPKLLKNLHTICKSGNDFSVS